MKNLGNISKCAIALSVFCIIWWLFFALPRDLFDVPYSTVLYSEGGELLGATTAGDGQWRFPVRKDLPEHFRTSVIEFEDSRFLLHPGIDLIAIGRALRDNLRSGKVVSGASTLSMQVIRLHRGNQARTIVEKLLEAILALRLELRYDKDEIFALWAAHAPFGGNVVGLDAASWRYYHRDPATLSWAEAATLAVLPNAPALIHPGKNRQDLLEKRNRLLQTLAREGHIDDLSLSLSVEEPLPGRPYPLPRLAPHLLSRVRTSHEGQIVHSTIDYTLQAQANEVVAQHYKSLSQNEIHNAAVLICHLPSNTIKAYVGNTTSGRDHGEDVDIVRAPRSSGSILKPFLYAGLNMEGKLLPQELVPDVPTQYQGYRPKNFYDQYDGAVKAHHALTRSLNIPAVRELRDYGVEAFHRKLKKMNFSTLDRNPDEYGLSLVLGGGEVTLEDLASAYGGMSRMLSSYHEREGRYYRDDWTSPGFILADKKQNSESTSPVIDAGAAWLTLRALTEVRRPATESGWEYFHGSRTVAWKTGTSIGFRDAWAVGVTPEYVVAVWVGNASGEGRPALVGVHAAGPLMFDLFDLLPTTSWYEPPWDELQETAVCSASGQKASPLCPGKDSVYIHKSGLRTLACGYHQSVQLDADHTYRVHAGCYPRQDMVEEVRFSLPPAIARYYRLHHSDYRGMPPMHPECSSSETRQVIDVIYPNENAIVSIPQGLSGHLGKVVAEAAHIDPDAGLYWHLDERFLGFTKGRHTMAIQPPVGRHRLTLVDKAGHEVVRSFDVR